MSDQSLNTVYKTLDTIQCLVVVEFKKCTKVIVLFFFYLFFIPYSSYERRK